MGTNKQKELFKELYTNDEFKKEFIENYLKKGKSEHFANTEHRNAFSLLGAEHNVFSEVPLIDAPVTSVRKAFLLISSYGLSFVPSDREAYITAKRNNVGKIEVDAKLGYRGMQSILMSAGKVKKFSSELIYESDTFNWLGSDKEPVIFSDGRQDGNLICGVVIFTLKDNSVLSYKMSQAELNEIMSNDIRTKEEVGIVEPSLYKTAWKDKCLRIALFRSVFKECREILAPSQVTSFNLDEVSSNKESDIIEQLTSPTSSKEVVKV